MQQNRIKRIGQRIVGITHWLVPWLTSLSFIFCSCRSWIFYYALVLIIVWFVTFKAEHQHEKQQNVPLFPKDKKQQDFFFLKKKSNSHLAVLAGKMTVVWHWRAESSGPPVLFLKDLQRHLQHLKHFLREKQFSSWAHQHLDRRKKKRLRLIPSFDWRHQVIMMFFLCNISSPNPSTRFQQRSN